MVDDCLHNRTKPKIVSFEQFSEILCVSLVSISAKTTGVVLLERGLGLAGLPTGEPRGALLGEGGAPLDEVPRHPTAVDEVLSLKPAGIILSPGPCDPDRAGICLPLISAAAAPAPMKRRFQRLPKAVRMRTNSPLIELPRSRLPWTSGP